MINEVESNTYVFIDNYADRIAEINRIFDKIEKKNIIFVCFERDYRRTYIESGTGHLEYPILSGIKMGKEEARTLIVRYDSFGLAGTGKKTDGAIDHFAQTIANDPIAIASCRIMHDFNPINRIAEGLVREASDYDRRAYLVAALARYCYAGGVRYDVLQSIVKSRTIDAQLIGKSPLKLGHPGRNASFLIPGNAVLSERILDYVKKHNFKELFEIYREIAMKVGERVNRHAIRRKTPEALLSGRLFDYDKVIKRFLGDDAALEFYVSVQKVWGWNSRYWEQLALLKLERAIASQASPEDAETYIEESTLHARHALRIESHPLSLTTLAKVLFARMAYYPNEASTQFEEAWNSATQAIKREQRWKYVAPTSYIVALNGAKTFMQLGGELSAAQKKEFYDVKQDIEKRRMFHGELRELCEDTQRML